MNKNRSFIFGLLFFLMVGIVLVPFNLAAIEGEEQADSNDKPLESGDLWKFIDLIKHPLASISLLLGLTVGILVKLSPVILVISGIKMWLLKRKLAIPWKLKPVEKLAVTTISQTIMELTFFFILMALFFPAVFSVFKNAAFMTGTTEGSQLLKFIITSVFVIPYHCITGGALGLLLINLLKPDDIKSLGKHIKFSGIIALITPVILIIFIVIARIVLKINYI